MTLFKVHLKARCLRFISRCMTRPVPYIAEMATLRWAELVEAVLRSPWESQECNLMGTRSGSSCRSTSAAIPTSSGAGEKCAARSHNSVWKAVSGNCSIDEDVHYQPKQLLILCWIMKKAYFMVHTGFGQLKHVHLFKCLAKPFNLCASSLIFLSFTLPSYIFLSCTLPSYIFSSFSWITCTYIIINNSAQGKDSTAQIL